MEDKNSVADFNGKNAEQLQKISVCIATYNGSKYILDQLNSIMPQLNAHDEVIISDDSSTDGTIKIIESINDKRIKLFPDQKFRDPIFNFENAIKNSTGDIIFLSDQDDIWDENKVQSMTYALKNADLAVCDCRFINDNNETLVDSYFDIVKSGPGILRNLKKNTYFGCCIAFKRKILKKALPFPKHIPMHDIWLGFVADLFYKPVFLPEALTYYRKHDNNASIASDVYSDYSLFKKLKFRINLIKYYPVLLLR